MKKLLLFALVFVATVTTAQERKFVIKGEMTSNKLCYSDETVNEVKLQRTIDGVQVEVATAPVVDGKFVFEGEAPEMIELCNITGFDNGSIPLFLEEGEIKVFPFDAAYPVAAKIGGSPSNEKYQEYLDLNNKCIQESKVRMKEVLANIPKEIQGNQDLEME